MPAKKNKAKVPKKPLEKRVKEAPVSTKEQTQEWFFVPPYGAWTAKEVK